LGLRRASPKTVLRERGRTWLREDVLIEALGTKALKDIVDRLAPFLEQVRVVGHVPKVPSDPI